MNKQNAALATFAVALFVFVRLIQRARAKLTPDQLHALERVQQLSVRSFVPLLPLAVCFGIVQFMSSYRMLMVWIACVAAALLIVLDGRRIQNNATAAGVPAECGRAYLIGMSILSIGFFASAAVFLSNFNWRA